MFMSLIMPNICILEKYISNLLEYLTGIRESNASIIRKHSRKLEQLGEISFPLSISNWYQLINRNHAQNNINIFQYIRKEDKLNEQIDALKKECKYHQINIERIAVKENDVHLYLQRSPYLFKSILMNVLNESTRYGSCDIFESKIIVSSEYENKNFKLTEIDLSTLRILELRDVSSNFLAFTTRDNCKPGPRIMFSLNPASNNHTSILCGPVLNEKGIKDSKMTAQQLLEKRTLDMQLMAQHRYKVQVIPNTPREEYFLKIVKKLGRASITVEMLSNKPNKSLKVTLNDLRTANRGAAFIFYNCARLSVLLTEFDKRVSKRLYPFLPDIAEVDFSVLSQPEEWELFYVYILQFPMVIKSCVKDIHKKIFNPQYLVTFLSNLSSLFSAYYRRVRILTDPRQHLVPFIHARIYLLKALQIVFHNALVLLNIEPIKEM